MANCRLMDFDQLETFLEVARLSSFSRAAERRFRTQPAISSQIRSLEEEVGAKLLDRSGGKVAITAAGKVFQKYAEENLEQRRIMLVALAEMHRVPRGEIVVSANEGTCLHILPEVFAEFKRQYPECWRRSEATGAQQDPGSYHRQLMRFRCGLDAGAGQAADGGAYPS